MTNDRNYEKYKDCDFLHFGYWVQIAEAHLLILLIFLIFFIAIVIIVAER